MFQSAKKKNQIIKTAKDSVGPAAKSLLLKRSESVAVPEDHYCSEAMQEEDSRLNDKHICHLVEMLRLHVRKGYNVCAAGYS